MGQRAENIPEIFPSDNDNDPKIEICVQVHTVQRLANVFIMVYMKWPRRTPLQTVNGITVSIGCTARKVFVCIIKIFPDCSSAQTYKSLKSLHHTNQNVFKTLSVRCLFEDVPGFFQLFQILRWCVDIVIVLCAFRPCFHFLSL